MEKIREESSAGLLTLCGGFAMVTLVAESKGQPEVTAAVSQGRKAAEVAGTG